MIIKKKKLVKYFCLLSNIFIRISCTHNITFHYQNFYNLNFYTTHCDHLYSLLYKPRLVRNNVFPDFDFNFRYQKLNFFDYVFGFEYRFRIIPISISVLITSYGFFRFCIRLRYHFSFKFCIILLNI